MNDREKIAALEFTVATLRDCLGHAEVEVAALRAENERLTRERDDLSGQVKLRGDLINQLNEERGLYKIRAECNANDKRTAEAERDEARAAADLMAAAGRQQEQADALARLSLKRASSALAALRERVEATAKACAIEGNEGSGHAEYEDACRDHARALRYGLGGTMSDETQCVCGHTYHEHYWDPAEPNGGCPCDECGCDDFEDAGKAAPAPAPSPRTDATHFFDKIGADRLADEVDVLVRRKVIDSRSPAADALLDYRDRNPSSPRSDRLVALEAESAALRSRVEELEAQIRGVKVLACEWKTCDAVEMEDGEIVGPSPAIAKVLRHCADGVDAAIAAAARAALAKGTT